VDLFPAAHAEGLRAESEAAIDIIGAVTASLRPNGSRPTHKVREDYDAYYVLSTLTADPLTNRFVRSDAAFAPKVLSGQPRSPTSTAPTQCRGRCSRRGDCRRGPRRNPLATVRLEDLRTPPIMRLATWTSWPTRSQCSGGPDLAGVDPGRIHEVARGATGSWPPTTPTPIGLNRRVVFTVTGQAVMQVPDGTAELVLDAILELPVAGAAPGHDIASRSADTAC